VPTEPLASGEVKLLKVEVPHEAGIRKNMPFLVNINFEADGRPEIKIACFYWSGDGPYCFKVRDVDYGSPGTIYVEPRAKDAGSYALKTYLFTYEMGRRNRLNA
jgi:hypothetical protein